MIGYVNIVIFKQAFPDMITITCVISCLKASEIAQAFQICISSLIKNALHTVSAWSCQHQLVLRQTAVDAKINEITTRPKLLLLLDIENNIITFDAMCSQKEIAK